MQDDALKEFIKLVNLLIESKTSFASFDEWLMEFNALRDLGIMFNKEELEKAWSNGLTPEEMAKLNDKKRLELPRPWVKSREEILASLPMYSQLKEAKEESHDARRSEEAPGIEKLLAVIKHFFSVAAEAGEHVTRDPWIEKWIIKYELSNQAYLYALNVIKDRWAEAEPLILTSVNITYKYICNVMHKRRWPEAEPILARNPSFSWLYARDVLKYRWQKAERKIFAHAGYARLYTDLFCSNCDGKGYNETSGGDKLECERCYGGGLDPDEVGKEGEE